MFILSDSGERHFLGTGLNNTAQEDLTLRLYVSDTTPTDSDTIGTYTEASQAGYSPETLTGSNFTVATVSGLTTATYPQVTFSFNESVTVYGYIVASNDGSTLIGAERFDVAKVVADTGSINVTLVLTMD